MFRTLLLTTAATALSAAAAFAEINAQDVVSAYQAEGFTRVEVKTGPTQVKVEAIRGTAKREVVYDRATGAVLKTETERVNAGDDTAPGVEISRENRDFTGRDDSDDDSDDSYDDSDDSYDDSDDRDDDSDDRDDDRDDDRGDDNGGDRDRGESGGNSGSRGGDDD